MDQEGIEDAIVPGAKDVRHRIGLHVEQPFHELVGLADELHIDVLDAIVDHLDVVARPVGSDMSGAGLPTLDRDALFIVLEGLTGLRVDSCGNRFPDRPERLPRLLTAAGHQRRAEASTELAARDPGTDEVVAGPGELFLAANGRVPVRVPTIDENVAPVDEWQEALDGGVHRVAVVGENGRGFDEQHDLARFLDGLHEFLESGVSHDAFGGGLVLLAVSDELLHLGGRSIVNADGIAVVGHVQDQVLAHDGQADEADVGLFWHFSRSVPRCFLAKLPWRVEWSWCRSSLDPSDFTSPMDARVRIYGRAFSAVSALTAFSTAGMLFAR